MDYYFVVLQLPGGKELKLRNDDDDAVREQFWAKAAIAIENKQAQIVCIRRDTGVSEDVRNHFADTKGFNTYLLFHLMLTDEEKSDEKAILLKATEMLAVANYETIIDADENFQLVVADYLDINSFKIN